MTPAEMAARIAELEAQLASVPKAVSRGPVMLSRDLECFASMDWGRLKPGCFAWWMAIPAEPETRYHIVAEWKFQGLDDEDIADGYHEMCKFLSLKPKYIAGDPSMWIADGRNRARGQFAARFFGEGLGVGPVDGFYLTGQQDQMMIRRAIFTEDEAGV